MGSTTAKPREIQKLCIGLHLTLDDDAGPPCTLTITGNFLPRGIRLGR